MSSNAWTAILQRLRSRMEEEDFRRWFGATAYASDSGDQITVWVPSEPIRRHIERNYREAIAQALRSLDRPNAHVRLVVAGVSDDDDESGDL